MKSNNKTLSVSIPESWIFKLKRKALKQTEDTGKHVSVSNLIVNSLKETYNFKEEYEK